LRKARKANGFYRQTAGRPFGRPRPALGRSRLCPTSKESHILGPSEPTGRSRAFAAALAAFFALSTFARPLRAADAGPRRVLVVTSFGSRFAPFEAYAAALRTGIVDGWPGPVEFFETPLEIARFEAPVEEEPFAGYLRSLVANRKLDLVVTIGFPAASFVTRWRPFPEAPTLIAGLERRQATDLAVAANDLVATAVYDPPAVVENALRLLPDTKRMAVVLGASPVERYWRGELERDLAPFAGRLTFDWWDGLPLDGMLEKAASMGPGTAILYATLRVDAAGIVLEREQGLEALRAVSSAPIFGGFEHQLGRGIVGGPLISIDRDADRAAALALSILRGEPIAQLTVPPPPPLLLRYDGRELRRFHIPESRLPAGSEVRFETPTLWDAYRGWVILGLAVFAIEASLIGGLLLQSARRRRAEEQVRWLSRRLLTAHEDERKAIARELHDDLSQRLARLALDASRLEYAAAIPIDGARPSPMRDELSRLSEDVHALAYQLHPTTLDDLGLEDALKTECERFARLESIAVALEPGEELGDVSKETALCLFRVAQESLRNVARHARAKSVSVACEPSGHGVRMTLRDDGVGFEPERGRPRPSLGLASMRERLQLIGGKLDVHSAPGTGTTITAWAPREARPS
jgi:signal transduction histidine kinase